MGALLLPYVAGVVTLLNPCVLPILPIIVATALGESRFGPAALAAGLTVSFSTLGLLLIAFGFSLGLDPSVVRMIAALILIAAGVILLVPAAQLAFASATQPLVQGGNQLLGRISGRGVAGQFAIGVVLGLVWTPCVGPTLGVAIASASQGKNLGEAFVVFFVFGLGVSTALMAFAYGARQALAARKAAYQSAARWGKPSLGALLILVGLMIATGLDKIAEAALLRIMPAWLIDITVRY
jgi:cytochrome c biogenesis protein CcdA